MIYFEISNRRPLLVVSPRQPGNLCYQKLTVYLELVVLLCGLFSFLIKLLKNSEPQIVKFRPKRS